MALGKTGHWGSPANKDYLLNATIRFTCYRVVLRAM
jgi:hypothetical protein